MMIFGALLHFSHEMEQSAKKSSGDQWISTRDGGHVAWQLRDEISESPNSAAVHQNFPPQKAGKIGESVGTNPTYTMWVIIHY